LPPNTQTLPSNYLAARSVISKAYEFALAHVGLDSLATPIWLEFIQFVKEGETRTTWEEQAKVGELRKIYTSVLRVPIEDVEGIWRQYDMFEGSVNKVTVCIASLRTHRSPCVQGSSILSLSFLFLISGQEVPRRTFPRLHDRPIRS
jgi:hypothetical protein